MLNAFLDVQTIRAHYKENFQKESTPKQLEWAAQRVRNWSVKYWVNAIY